MKGAATGTLSILVGALLLTLPWAASAAADVAQVSIVSPGGTERTLALDALAGSEDVVDRPYALRAASSENTRAITGFSLAALLDATGADPYGFSYLEVQRPAGGALLLSRDQALAGGGDGPPVVYASEAGTGFLRPSTGVEDLNATDSFTAPQGIAIVLRKGTHLKVRAMASTRRTRPEETVEFNAIVEQAGSGEQLEFSWYFDDGASATSSETTHAFAKRGSYDVVLGVTTDGNDTGVSAVVTIQVGPPVGGPDRKGGGRNDDASAPDHGAATGPESADSSPPALPAADLADGPIGCTPPDTQHGRRPCVRRGATDRPAPKPEQHRPPPPGEQVIGELVSATTDIPEPESKQAAARSGQIQDNGAGGGIPGAAWGILATLGLLGLGALVETRSLLP